MATVHGHFNTFKLIISILCLAIPVLPHSLEHLTLQLLTPIQSMTPTPLPSPPAPAWVEYRTQVSETASVRPLRHDDRTKGKRVEASVGALCRILDT